jgi:hypothetical protein
MDVGQIKPNLVDPVRLALDIIINRIYISEVQRDAVFCKPVLDLDPEGRINAAIAAGPIGVEGEIGSVHIEASFFGLVAAGEHKRYEKNERKRGSKFHYWFSFW